MGLSYKITDYGQPILLSLDKDGKNWNTAEHIYQSQKDAQDIIDNAIFKLKVDNYNDPIKITDVERNMLRVEGQRFFIEYGRGRNFTLYDSNEIFLANPSTSFIKREEAKKAIEKALYIDINGERQEIKNHTNNINVIINYAVL